MPHLHNSPHLTSSRLASPHLTYRTPVWGKCNYSWRRLRAVLWCKQLMAVDRNAHTDKPRGTLTHTHMQTDTGDTEMHTQTNPDGHRKRHTHKQTPHACKGLAKELFTPLPCTQDYWLKTGVIKDFLETQGWRSLYFPLIRLGQILSSRQQYQSYPTYTLTRHSYIKAHHSRQVTQPNCLCVYMPNLGQVDSPQQRCTS